MCHAGYCLFSSNFGRDMKYNSKLEMEITVTHSLTELELIWKIQILSLPYCQPRPFLNAGVEHIIAIASTLEGI